jgi:hypothetical protein
MSGCDRVPETQVRHSGGAGDSSRRSVAICLCAAGKSDVKPILIFCCGLVIGVAANARAADPVERDTGLRPPVQDQPRRAEPQRAAERPMPQREMPPPGGVDRGRLSSDERRQLRRDIQDAGKDIYHRERPMMPRREQRR